MIAVRWLAWLPAVLSAPWHPDLPRYATLLLVTLLANAAFTALVPQYLRMAQRSPFVLTLDIVYATAVLLVAGPWLWVLLPYALASLVASGLLFGWRGGLMSGLTLVSLTSAVRFTVGQSLTTMIGEQPLRGWGELLLVMVVPPIFGLLFPTFAVWLRERSRPLAGRSPGGLPQIGPPREQTALFGGSGNTGRAPSIANTNDGGLAPQVRAAVRPAEHGAEELRRELFAPGISSEAELAAALELVIGRFTAHTTTVTRVIQLGRPRPVSRAAKAVLVRLAQEALLNIQQHSHAESAELTLRYDAGTVALLIQDTGVGLLDGTYEPPGLHALRAMRYRLGELGGRLDVFESELGGVSVRAVVPLDLD